MQNHCEITSKISFGPEASEIEPKLWLRSCPDLPRPVQEDKSLSAKRAFLFLSSEFDVGFLRLYSCSLRQGAGDKEFPRFGSRTSFLRWFYKRSQTYFGQNSEAHIKTIKKRGLEVKTTISEKKRQTPFCWQGLVLLDWPWQVRTWPKSEFGFNFARSGSKTDFLR